MRAEKVSLSDENECDPVTRLKHDSSVIYANQWNYFRSSRHDFRHNQHEHNHGQ